MPPGIKKPNSIDPNSGNALLRDIVPDASFRAVTPSDSADIPGGPARALYIGGAGNVAVVNQKGVSVLFTVPAGMILPITTTRVLSTGTTATNIVAL